MNKSESIDDINRALRVMGERLARLEATVYTERHATSNTTVNAERPARSESKVNTERPGYITVSRPTASEKPGAKPGANPDGAPGAKPDAAPDTSDRNFEKQVGRVWLNRLGVLTLVTGIVLFIVYSFHYFDAFAKIATGFIASAALLGLGEFMERRDQKVAWYARGLTGGGWALAFFTTWAMTFVPSVRLVPDPVIALRYLTLVALLCVAHAVHKNSQLIAAFGLLFGFLAVPNTDAAVGSAIAIIILSVCSAAVASKMRWLLLYVLAVPLAYCGVVVIGGHSATIALGSTARALMTVVLYSVIWLANTLYAVNHRAESGNSRLAHVFCTIFSAFFFYFGCVASLQILIPHADLVLRVVMTTAYWLCHSFMHRRGNVWHGNLMLLASLYYGTAVIPELVSSDVAAALQAIEVIFLLALGTLQNKIAMRYFALALAAGLAVRFDDFMPILHPLSFSNSASAGDFAHVLLPRLALTVCATIAAVWYHFKPSADNVERGWQKLFIYIASLNYLALTPLFLHLARHWGWCDAVTAGHLHALLWSMQTLILSCIHCHTHDALSEAASHVYRVISVVAMQSYLADAVPQGLVSGSWAALGSVLLIVGFALRLKSYRLLGLYVFACVMAHLLLVDLATVETLQRIGSFVGAGLVLLLSSLAYTHLESRLDSNTASNRAADKNQSRATAQGE